MHQKQKDLQKRFEGLLQTPSVWKGKDLFNLQQFYLPSIISKISININEKQRLGKYVEQLVFYQLKQNNITVLLENVQIQKNKTTLGEIDCIIQKNNSTIHLEIVYKFYLYDDKVGDNEIEHFIGPNRKDALVKKLHKLKNKQLPFLYSTESKNLLNSHNISVIDIEQQVCFKAQLFLPYTNNVTLNKLNTSCISGFYIYKYQLKEFLDCKFYLPNKKDWLITPHKNVDWQNFNIFKLNIEEYLERKFSPMVWIKQQNGELLKYFLVWW